MITADANGENHRQIQQAAPEFAKYALGWSRHLRMINLLEKKY